MFIGDAQQEATSISPQSVKGALRFWWRALRWGEIRSKEKFNTDELALKELHKQEAELFGSAKDETTKTGGHGKFSLKVSTAEYDSVKKDNAHANFRNYTAARYFGYGLMEAFGQNAGVLSRSCIQHNQTFSVTLIFKEQAEKSILDALTVMGLLGGLGSRVRRGIGSIQIETLTSYNATKETKFIPPKTLDEYKTAITKYITQPNVSMPFSTFTNKTRIDCLVTKTTPFEVLNDLAKGMMMYRSWGKDGLVLGQDREGNFKTDHDWKYGKHVKDFHPRRVIFGLPHNYGKGAALAVMPELQNKPYPDGYFKHDRRASPLWLHIHQIGSQFIGVATLFPADFLPKGEKINAGGKNVPTKVEWSVLTNFLDGKTKQGSLRFPDKKAILKGENL
jgi:CRISPR-associated protein Cmr1